MLDPRIHSFLSFILLTFLPFLHAQLDCSEAPTSALRIVCEQLHRWDTNARVGLLYFYHLFDYHFRVKAAPPVETKIPLPPAIPGLPGKYLLFGEH